jgi:hypothetical protein
MDADGPLAVYDATPGTRAPGSASGACGVAPYSPWSPSFPPSAPLPHEGRCSHGSAVLCWCLTSPDHTSQASAVCLPCADPLDTRVSPEISQFLCTECTRMPRLSDRAASDDGSRERPRPCCLPLAHRCRHAASNRFRGAIPRLRAPLPTSRLPPHGDLRTARGRCGSLDLHRRGLAPPAPCQSPGKSGRSVSR